MHAAELPAACENCGMTLQGAYCHACGQQAANPLRSLHHAIEDVFESFWHLDGRVFRTLRELFVPGRVACNYLAGQRVRYIAPLRLFVVLTLLTFFIGQLALGGSEGTVRAAAEPQARAGVLQSARSEAEVHAALAQELAALRKARERVQAVPGAATAIQGAEQELRAQAEARIAALRGPGALTPSPSPAPTPTPAPASAAANAEPPVENPREGVQAFAREVFGDRLRDRSAPWHEHDNPVDVTWLPAFGDRWFNHRMANAEENIGRIERNGDGYLLTLALAAVPSALFVLVPVFALLLKLFYLGGGRGYLEHLVVALYSHAYLLLVLLASFLLAALEPAGASRGPVGVLVGIGQFIVWSSVPVYLLVMQHRVYAQRWALTVAKFALLGFAYQFLVIAAVVYTVFAGLTSGS